MKKKDKSTPTNLSKIVINHKLDKLAKKDLFLENVKVKSKKAAGKTLRVLFI